MNYVERKRKEREKKKAAKLARKVARADAMTWRLASEETPARAIFRTGWPGWSRVRKIRLASEEWIATKLRPSLCAFPGPDRDHELSLVGGVTLGELRRRREARMAPAAVACAFALFLLGAHVAPAPQAAKMERCRVAYGEASPDPVPVLPSRERAQQEAGKWGWP